MGKESEILRQLLKDGIENPQFDPASFNEKVLFKVLEKDQLEFLIKAVRQEMKSSRDDSARAILRLLLCRIFKEKNKYEEIRKEARRALKEKGLQNRLRAYAYIMIARSYIDQADLSNAETFCKKALGFITEEDSATFALMQNTIGVTHGMQGRQALALEYFQSARRAWEKVGDSEMVFDAIHNIAITLTRLGRQKDAIQGFEEVLDFARKLENNTYIAYALANLAEKLIEREEYKKALDRLEEALNLFEELDHKNMYSYCHVRFARTYQGLGENKRALSHAKKAVAFADETGRKMHIAVANEILGYIMARQGDPQAEMQLMKSFKLNEELQTGGQGGPLALLEYGKLLISKGDMGGAEYVADVIEYLKKQSSIPVYKRLLKEAEEVFETVPEESRPIREVAPELDRKSLRKILEISKEINSETELSSALELVVDAAISISGAERGLITIGNNGKLRFSAVMNFGGEIAKDPSYQFISTIAGRVIEDGKALIVSDVRNSKELSAVAADIPEELKTVFAFPLSVESKTVGTVYLDSRFAVIELPEILVDMLLAVTEQAAIIMDKIRRYEEVSKLSAQLEKKVERQDIELKETLSTLENKQNELEDRYAYSSIIGRGAKMRDVFTLLEKVAESALPVCIYGESGTGKELAARAVHYNGPRKEKHFVAINCASIPENLLETELFGHEKGAFTGAFATKKGLFELADGGTIMLDEIGDMSEAMQAKLLRVAEEEEIRRIGGSRPIKIDVRIISASNKRLQDLVEAGAFREDLFYRLSVLQMTLPPLRERKEDIPLLVEHIWERASGAQMQATPEEKSAFLGTLMEYSWPGNVRELENEINRIVSLGEGSVRIDLISGHILESAAGEGASGSPYPPEAELRLPVVEKALIIRALNDSNGNKSKAASLLEIPRSTLLDRIKKYGISIQRRISM
ncbi:MAG: sigma 54-interacting transcriptional regulator [Planctomycetota bacterium]